MDFEDFYKNEFKGDSIEDARTEYDLIQIAVKAYYVVKNSGLKYTEIAKRMGICDVEQILNMTWRAYPHNMSIKTLVCFAKACGYTLVVDFIKDEIEDKNE